MAIEIDCDCGKSYLVGPQMLTVEKTKDGPIVTFTCPHCREKQMALAREIKEKEEYKNGKKKT
ncbi:MAG: hypothetical protein PHC97_01395 [Patescibacteria group bacterium]|nr:hypothetical protein [Patescibacteria group bacterium]